MKLYFSPLTGSLAARCALYEAGAEAEYLIYDRFAKRLADGGSLATVNPMEQIPTLVLNDGTVIGETLAVLLHIADTHPDARLVPRDRPARSQVERWLSFVAAELHASFFVPFFERGTPEAVKAHLITRLPRRMVVLNAHLAGQDHLAASGFSVADIYLYTVLNWVRLTGVDLAAWPHVAAHHARIAARPAVKRAFNEEKEIYRQAQGATG